MEHVKLPYYAVFVVGSMFFLLPLDDVQLLYGYFELEWFDWLRTEPLLVPVSWFFGLWLFGLLGALLSGGYIGFEHQANDVTRYLRAHKWNGIISQSVLVALEIFMFILFFQRVSHLHDGSLLLWLASICGVLVLFRIWMASDMLILNIFTTKGWKLRLLGSMCAFIFLGWLYCIANRAVDGGNPSRNIAIGPGLATTHKERYRLDLKRMSSELTLRNGFNLRGARLANVQFGKVIMDSVDLRGADLRESIFPDSSKFARLQMDAGTQLRQTRFMRCTVIGDWTMVNIGQTFFTGSNLTSVLFDTAQVRAAGSGKFVDVVWSTEMKRIFWSDTVKWRTFLEKELR